jgi:N-acetylglucosaminyldiphosphoundecaprenol N-acetyl-beta-D-mannosaminyltransferase
MEKVSLFGVQFSNLTMDEAIQNIDRKIVNFEKHEYIVTPNVDHIVQLKSDKEFQKVYQSASLILVDGMPIVFLSKLFNKKLKEKVSGADLVYKLFELASIKKYKVFMLGGQDGVLEKAIEKINQIVKKPFPISGYSPKFGFEKDPDSLKETINKINEFQPDILLVCLGAPKGEKFIYNFLDSLNCKVSIQVGAAVDFVSGNIKRAPHWMQTSGLEWFYRFLQEPKRMFKRYFINDSIFIKVIIDEAYTTFIRRNKTP